MYAIICIGEFLIWRSLRVHQIAKLRTLLKFPLYGIALIKCQEQSGRVLTLILSGVVVMYNLWLRLGPQLDQVIYALCDNVYGPCQGLESFDEMSFSVDYVVIRHLQP